jgi:hypothetical protein
MKGQQNADHFVISPRKLYGKVTIVRTVFRVFFEEVKWETIDCLGIKFGLIETRRAVNKDKFGIKFTTNLAILS